MHLTAPIHRLKRRARDIARAEGIALSQALDRIAVAEGFAAWSHLAATLPHPAPTLLRRFDPGDLVLIAARPGHGKTLLALELAVDAVRAGRQAHVFTLDYHEAEVLARLRDLRNLGADPASLGAGFHLDTSDDICADHILARLGAPGPGTVVVVDYLQILDQERSHPPLDAQLRTLSEGAKRLGIIVLLISQVDRAYARTGRDMPGLDDIRLPNPMDVGLLTKACFLQDGKIRFQDLAPSPA